MKRYLSIRRTVAIGTGITVAVQVAACGTAIPRDGAGQLRAEQIARITTHGEWVRGKARSLGTVSVGEYRATAAGEFLVPPGQHDFLVTATWSNEFKDTTRFVAEVQPGKTYFVLIYELERGQDPKTADVRQKSFAELILSAGGAGVLGALATFGWPIALYHETRKAPDKRPFEGCCYVWLEDAASGQIVAGTSPREPTRP